MPTFDEWGMVPAGHRGPRANPWAAEPEYMDEPPEPEEAEESAEEEASRSEDPLGEDEASRGTDPVGEGIGSSRSAHAEVDLQVLSSSNEEGTSRVVRSQRAEEEEETSGGGRGRCEPRSKAVHDRRAATARDTPCAETGADREEAGASNTPRS